MKLSVYLITKDSEPYVERLLRVARTFADELVIAVDRSSTDDTERICRGYADTLFTVDPLGSAGRARAWITSQCSGDWILYLDDDELPSSKLVAALPRLMVDRDATHHWTEIRWLFGQAPMSWLTAWPWRPCWSLRLMRNLPSLIRAPGLLHSGVRVAGDGSFVTEGAIYHLDAVYHDEARRRRKVQGYTSFGEGDPLAEFYLPEIHPMLTTLPIPADDPFWEPPAGQPLRRAAGAPAGRHVTADELRRAVGHETEIGPAECRGTVSEITVPAWVPAGKLFFADIDVENGSDITWYPPGPRQPNVRLAYHWLRPNGAVYEFDGLRTDLPRTLRPGAAARMAAMVVAPTEDGTYLLQWDPVVEQVTWFSGQGWRGPDPTVVTVGFGSADTPQSSSSAVPTDRPNA